MRIKQAAIAQRGAHLAETGHGDCVAQDIRFEMGADGRVEEADKGLPSVFTVFHNGARHHIATAGAKQSRYGVAGIVIEISPGGQT